MIALFDQLTALADPTRARLLLALEGQELSVRELQEILQLPQSTVSRHLKQLADEEWVLARPDGTSHRYRFLTPTDGSPRHQLWHLVRSHLTQTPSARGDAGRVRAVLAQRHTRSREFFASEAGQWDRLREDLFGRRYELTALLALLQPGWVVGDLGCGTASFASQLAPFVRRVIAVDESQPMLDAARERIGPHGNIELRQGELELLPVNEAELDLAALLLVLPYVPDPGRVLAETARALQPGGRVVVVDLQPHDRGDWEHTMGHLWRGFSPGQILGWMNGAGLRDARCVALPPLPEARGPGLFVASAFQPA